MRSQLAWIATTAYLAIRSAQPATAAPLPVITQDFPDPSIINVDDQWYAFATQGNGKKVQIAQTKVGDLRSWKLLDEDALPNTGEWSTGTNIWAPQRDGSFVLYYAADVAQKGPKGQTLHCVGAATSRDIKGPYKPLKDAIACPTDMGGAIDISGYIDSDGTTVVIYKIDGNSIALRRGLGPKENVMGDLITPIVMQKMKEDGVTPEGDPKVILDRGAADGPLVEAPSLFRDGAGTYFLGFSSNMYDTEFYDVSYATSKSLFGPYTKTKTPLLESRTTGLFGPGGAEFDRSGKVMAYHGILEKKVDDKGYTSFLRRGLFIADVATDGDKLKVTRDW